MFQNEQYIRKRDKQMSDALYPDLEVVRAMPWQVWQSHALHSRHDPAVFALCTVFTQNTYIVQVNEREVLRCT
jgi:hypothetical protein